MSYLKLNNGGIYFENKKKSTIEYINNLFKEIEDTLIFISPGNHDPFLQKSYYNNFIWNDNVKIFTPRLEKVETEEADIYGYGFGDFYCSNFDLDKLKIENPNKLNILIIHGTLDGKNSEEMQYNSMSKKRLQEKGFDYIALGHIHKNNFSPDENIIYPGSTIGMGFDELGKHGMVTGEINKNDNKIEFIQLDDTEFEKIEINCTEINSIEELIEKINLTYLNKNNLYEIILTGKRNFEINIQNLYKYNLDEKIIKIKNKTIINYDIEKISNENNLKGLFAKEIIEEINKNNYDKKIIDRALEIGMEILNK